VLQGIDVSNNQGVIDWAQVAAARVDQTPVTFVLLKRSQGTNFTDQYFAANWGGAKQHNLERGAYHFAVPARNTPEAEAAYFLAQLPALATYDQLALDYEPDEAAYQLHPDDWMLRFCAKVEAATGVTPMIYTNKSIAAMTTNTALARYPLWLACIDGPIPARIGVWPTIALWQYRWTGRVAGIAGNVDLNKLECNLAGLRALGKAPVKPAYPRPGMVTVPGSLKTQASHASGVAIDPHHAPVWLEVGASLSITGPVTHSDDYWLPVSLVRPEQLVHGWYPQGHLAEHP
jgi:lysozyme